MKEQHRPDIPAVNKCHADFCSIHLLASMWLLQVCIGLLRWVDNECLCVLMQNFGVSIDESKNKQHIGKPGEIQTDDSRVKVLVIPTDEELSIAQQTLEVIRAQ